MSNMQGSRTIPFQFQGNAIEYFKIWIVNITLSILTLGIYSAWAKVRTKRYFYGNTLLDGSSFEYLANPLSILQGRFIVLGVVLIYVACVQVFPILEPAFFFIYIIALPWIVIKSLQFNTHNSSYRNIRFNFDGKLLEAAYILIGLFILTLVTFGLAFPYFIKRLNQFSIEHSYFGKSKFSIQATTGAYFKIYLKILIIPIIGIIAAIAIPAYQTYIENAQLANQSPTPIIEQEIEIQPETLPPITTPPQNQTLDTLDPTLAIFAGLLPMILSLAFYIFIWVYIQTRIANLVYNNTNLDVHTFQSSMRVRDMFWLHFVNIIATIVSLGLLIPWAKIRIARYRATHLTLHTTGKISDFVANEQMNVKATAAEFADALDVDLGF